MRSRGSRHPAKYRAAGVYSALRRRNSRPEGNCSPDTNYQSTMLAPRIAGGI